MNGTKLIANGFKRLETKKTNKIRAEKHYKKSVRYHNIVTCKTNISHESDLVTMVSQVGKTGDWREKEP